MENGGRTHLPNDKPSVLGELPNELVGRPGFRVVVVAIPDGTKLLSPDGQGPVVGGYQLLNAVSRALEA